MSGELPLLPEDISWEEAQAKLEALDLGDGLPLVPPTMSRYEAMVSNRGSPEESFGFLMPLMGNLTLGTAAYNCVIAGCRPEDLPGCAYGGRSVYSRRVQLAWPTEYDRNTDGRCLRPGSDCGRTWYQRRW